MQHKPYSWRDNHLICALLATTCLAGVGGVVAFVYLAIQLMATFPLFRALMLPLLFWLALYSVFRRPGSNQSV